VEQPQPKPKKQVSLGVVVTLICIVAICSFIVGTRSTNVLASLLSSQNKAVAADLDYRDVEAVYDKLRQSYDGKLNTTALIEGAKKGLVEAAGDPYTVYFTKEEAKEFMSDLQGTFSGIGAELARRDEQLLITATLDDSPARKAGLQASDVIVKVNDEDASSWAVDKAVSAIRGEKGTTVKITVLRNQELKEFSITRDEISTPSVKWEVVDSVGYIRLARFADDTAELARQAADELKSKGVKSIVLDLRGNGGGYLTAARDVSSLWLDDKVVVQERTNDKVTETLRSGTDAPLAGMPTIVLIDGGSASASEIVAGALQDNKVATLMGEKTFGKGSVQDILDFSNGGQLKVTVAKWYTPNGKNISKEGIAPDNEVKMSDQDLKNNKDTQKDTAIDRAKTLSN
jgi:carboxyl-terminal processing protease